MATASFIDIEMARRGCVLPEYEGVHIANAADHVWHREPHELEADFLDRVRREAADAGFSSVAIGGAINTRSDNQ